MKAGRSVPRLRLNLISTAALFLAVVVLLLPSVGLTQPAPAPKRILVLYWYSRDWPGNISFDENFRAVLQSTPAGTVEYYAEYLESNRFPGENQSLLLRDYLRQKYADRPIDVVVTVTDAPLDFLLKYRDELFSQAPIVFVATRHITPEELAAGPGLTGITIHGDEYRNTLDLALRLHPHTEEVFIVSGTLERDKRFETKCREQFQDFEKRVSINYLTDLSPDELIVQTKSLPERSIVLYVFQQSKNEQGKILETADILDMIGRSTPVPIYGLASWQVGRGIVGGFLRTLDANGTRTAQMALQIVNGVRAQDIKVENVPTLPMFDWRELRRWGISEESLPPGSIVRFRVPSFWDEYRWYLIGLSSLFIVQSALIAGLVVNRTRRKRAEEERRHAQSEVAESQARLAGIIGSAMDAIISVDQNQRIVLFNDAAQKMFGCSEREAVGQAIDRFIPERFREPHQNHFRTFGATGVTKRAMGPLGSISGRRVDGEEFPIEASISQLDLSGQMFYTIILRDITKRRQASEALRESEARFRNMADTAPVMIWVSDADKICTYLNQQWLDFTGRSLEDELANGWAADIHPEDYERCLETYVSAFDRRAAFTMEYRLRRADGEFRWVYDSGTPRHSPNGKFLGYIGSCIDISERKAAEEALEDLSGQLIRARENECARIARELHDDLSQRIAIVSIGLEQLERIPLDKLNGWHKSIREILRQTGEISQELHRMSHDLHPSKLLHLGLVAALESLCADLSKNRSTNIRFSHKDVPSDLTQEVSLCFYRITQECLNNVIKHSRALQAEVELCGTGEDLQLRVSDSGIGFDVESPKIAKGIGLIGMRERLRLVGGRISIDSSPSQGTRVEAIVPLARKYPLNESRSPELLGENVFFAQKEGH